MMIAPLRKDFIILAAFIQNVFYVLDPPNTKEVRVCFDFEDCSQWRSMKRSYVYDELTNISKLNVTNNLTMFRYKLQIVFDDHSIGETQDWYTAVAVPEDQMLFTSDYIILFILAGVLICKFAYVLIYFAMKYRNQLNVLFRLINRNVH